MSTNYKKTIAVAMAAAMLASSAAPYALAETTGAGTVSEASDEAVIEVSGAADIEALKQKESEAPEGQLTISEVEELNGGAEEVFIHDGKVTLIKGTCTDSPVTGEEDAGAVVDSMIWLMGGNEKTSFDPVDILTDTAGNQYYVFQQMYGDTTVPGGAVKIITDSDGKMLSFSGCVESELPEANEGEGIPAEEAEAIVSAHEEEAAGLTVKVHSDWTEKILLPSMLEIDLYADDAESASARYVWAVYTDASSSSEELPYKAHYVNMAGEYLYSMPTIIPGDAAGSSGFDAEYLFEFMEPAEYTGYVDLSDGTEKEISVTVMRDRRTGMYYLGNLERRIVVADCYEFLYNNGNVVVEYSPDNKEWDQIGLLSLYNYCIAWDYYNEIGWHGPDGEGTPILILNNFCDKDHYMINNACYCGEMLGWQIFAASQANDYSQCIDVIAHETTHCVTGATTTYNAYVNDYGAINEAMSDIQGQFCKMMNGNETEWLMGEGSSTIVRSMSDPHLLQQPEFSWDIYYHANVKTPTGINDHGGVHTNSSLLNYLAYRMYTDGGMTLEDARAFWFAVDCTMVPQTDYAQLADILPVVLGNLGMEQYGDALSDAIITVKLGDNRLPEEMADNRALVNLVLPDTEAMTDGNWMLMINSLNIEKLIDKIRTYVADMMAGDYSFFPESVEKFIIEQQAAEEAKPVVQEEEPGLLELIGDILSDMSEDSDTDADDKAADTVSDIESELPEAVENSDLPDEVLNDLMKWLKKEADDVYTDGNGNAGQDDRTINMVSGEGYTIPLLMHLRQEDPMSDRMDQLVFAAYIGGRWFDLSSVFPDENNGNVQDALMEAVGVVLEHVADKVTGIESLEDLKDIFFTKISGGEFIELSADGLEEIELPEGHAIPMDEASLVTEGKKSRPKDDASAEIAEAAEENAAAEAEEQPETIDETPDEVQDENVEPASENAQDDAAEPAA